MDSQFSPRIKDIIGYSREEAIRLGNDYIGQEHLFLGILRDGEGIATDILENLGVDAGPSDLEAYIRDRYGDGEEEG